MHHTELLHRFFDDGLTEPLEDTLFGQMAVDPELRRQFVEHMKLHSMIQEDVASITTPSHVTQQLFVNLGLVPPEIVPAVESAWKKRTAAFVSATGALFHEYRGYIATALLAAGITAVLFMSTMRDTLPSADLATGDTESHVGSGIEHSLPDQPSELDFGRPATGSAATASDRISRGNGTPYAAGRGAAAMRGGGAVAAMVEPAEPVAFAVPSSQAERPVDAEHPAHIVADDVRIQSIPLLPPSGAETSASIDEREIETVGASTQAGLIEPWHFFRPVQGNSVFSNLVVELRQQYGRSYPNVDLPHNSHKVFENLALNVVYKATDHHAFGFEYGREDFGQVYERTVPAQQYRTVDPNMVQVGGIPAQNTLSEFRERRMLDIFGAVWKLSLPEYGLLGAVYPYMRTFVGATNQGPLGKVRIGIEMYPSNFSMFNLGVEGGLLRYSVEQSAYYSAKLNYSFGVAIGF